MNGSMKLKATIKFTPFNEWDPHSTNAKFAIK